jgi:translation initiation factor 1 (eIF-1/SUI1)
MDLAKLIAAKPPKLPGAISDASVKKAHGKFVTAVEGVQKDAKTFKASFDKGTTAGNDFYTVVETAAKAAQGPDRKELMSFLQEVLTYKRDNLT